MHKLSSRLQDQPFSLQTHKGMRVSGADSLLIHLIAYTIDSPQEPLQVPSHP